MSLPQPYSFTRYLAAKKGIDDRALNRVVWHSLKENMPPSSRQRPLKVLEIGAGIGTMIERLWDWGLLDYVAYTALDADMDNMVAAWQRLDNWARQQPDIRRVYAGDDLVIEADERLLEIRFLSADFFEFVEAAGTYDLLIANAFLDLVDIPSTLPLILHLLRPGGLFYFTINFDGITVFEPEIDPQLDSLIQELYHRTMDERVTAGKPAGDSRAGRHLFGQLKAAGAEILQAGASDWVVFSGQEGYPMDEAYFLHFILHTVHQALAGRPELAGGRLDDWIGRRHRQVQDGELVYIAHQVDFVGRMP